MTGMTLELTTDNIQYLIIALINSDVYRKGDIPADVSEELQNVLCELNTMCSEKNNYTLNVEVTA